MKKIINRASILIVLLGILILPYFVFADSPLNALGEVGKNAGYASASQTTVSSIAGTIVYAVMSLLGIIFIILTIYAGIEWMTAGGDEAKVEKAQKVLRNAIVGLLITVSVVAIFALIQTAFKI